MGASSEARGGTKGAWPHQINGRTRDAAVFASGAAAAVLVLVAAASFLAPTTNPAALFGPLPTTTRTRTFYDDPALSYSVVHGNDRLTGWDAKRAAWLRSRGLDPSSPSISTRVVMVSGSQPEPCAGKDGDYLLVRFLKNKLDYCRLHGIQLLYNRAHLEPTMPGFWAKLPILRAAMLAHPEAEWLWWVDVDAVVTDMDFSILLLAAKYNREGYNLVVHGAHDRLFKRRSWLGVNAGVFLIRNCQWSLDFVDQWARMGPAWPETYTRWGKTLRAQLADRDTDGACDQSALVYMLLRDWERLKSKVRIETEFCFQGYWADLVDRFPGVAERYHAVEREEQGGNEVLLRRRHAEREHVAHAAARNAAVRRAVPGPDGGGVSGWRRPFVTHFTGCAPCSGQRNPIYSAESCDGGMRAALDFADDQVLRAYGFRHVAPGNDTVTPLPFDYPAVAGAPDHGR
ncbi:hypothetical protein QOZ80_9BG0712350 [Eleusine coracana subsp. coracana]|nr:hypothetical protein QOZ80_9BG0712340 [Eleusine coracana subsp. coracana]KAK3119012.1 hypothetical protein QOZ80_9BG0712350 [Eleusine coracana subsp. coracana]